MKLLILICTLGALTAQAAPPVFRLAEWLVSPLGRMVILETAEGQAIATRLIGRPATGLEDIARLLQSMNTIEDAALLSEHYLSDRLERIQRLAVSHPLFEYEPEALMRAIARRELRLDPHQTEWIEFLPSAGTGEGANAFVARRSVREIFLRRSPELSALLERMNTRIRGINLTLEVLGQTQFRSDDAIRVLTNDLGNATDELSALLNRVGARDELSQLSREAQHMRNQVSQAKSKLEELIRSEENAAFTGSSRLIRRWGRVLERLSTWEMTVDRLQRAALGLPYR